MIQMGVKWQQRVGRTEGSGVHVSGALTWIEWMRIWGVVRNGDAGIRKGDEHERIWMEMRPGVALRWHCYRFQGCLVRVVFGQYRAAFPLGY